MPKCRRSDTGCGPSKRPKVPADEAHAVRGALFGAHCAVARQLEDGDPEDPAPFSFVKAGMPGSLWAMYEVGCDLSTVGENCEGESLAICAAMRGRAECMKVLADTGCDLAQIDFESGMAPVHWAADSIDRGEDDPACLAVLRQAGCDMNLKSLTGCTAAHYAAACGFERKLRFLSSAGCDLGHADMEGRTAADLAAQFGHHDALRFLRDAAK